MDYYVVLKNGQRVTANISEDDAKKKAEELRVLTESQGQGKQDDIKVVPALQE